MGQQVYCTEARVKQIVQAEVYRSVMAYERRVGNPRHVENQYLLKQIRGGVLVVKWLLTISIPLLGIYVAWRHK